MRCSLFVKSQQDMQPGQYLFDFGRIVLADSDAVVKVESELVFVVLHQFADHFVANIQFSFFTPEVLILLTSVVIFSLPAITEICLPVATDRKSTRLNSSHSAKSRMPSSA